MTGGRNSAALSLEMEARRAAQTGRDEEAARLWARLLEASPDNAQALVALGLRALRHGEGEKAREMFRRAVSTAPDQPKLWLNLAVACRTLGDDSGEIAALDEVLARDPYELVALMLKAANLERQGRERDAVRVHSAVLAVAPPMEQLAPDLRAAVVRAREVCGRNQRELDAFLTERLSVAADRLGETPARFAQALDIVLGRKKRYQQEPVQFYYPGLAPIYFFEREEFPWLDAFEAATDAIRAEAAAILAEDRGIEPYVAYPPGVPLNQWQDLNHSKDWGAFHLWRNGAPVVENCARAPVTAKLLEQVPAPRLPGRSPAAMFSVLKPRTRIPPHTGVTNVRLVTHVPLIVPEGCGFRVGSDTRQWREGNAWVFDDTIEHEAWNNSDQLRVVLIFDIWHPHLSESERELVAALMQGMDAFSGGTPAADL